MGIGEFVSTCSNSLGRKLELYWFKKESIDSILDFTTSDDVEFDLYWDNEYWISLRSRIWHCNHLSDVASKKSEDFI